MADLGEFGHALAELDDEPDTFRFHGEQFQIPAGVSPLPMMRFAWRQKVVNQAEEQATAKREAAQAQMDRAYSDAARAVHQDTLTAAEMAQTEASLDRMACMYEFMQGCLPDEDEWQRFQRTAIKHRVQADELMQVCSAIFAAASGRPTSRPSGSSDGPSNTGDTSTGVSASPGPTGGPRPPDTAWEPDPNQVRVLTAAELQRRQFFSDTVPVGELLAAQQ